MVPLGDTLEDLDDDGVVLETLRRDQGGPERLIEVLAAAIVHGLPVSWTGLLPGRHVDLPTYAFQHKLLVARSVGLTGRAPILLTGLTDKTADEVDLSLERRKTVAAWAENGAVTLLGGDTVLKQTFVAGASAAHSAQATWPPTSVRPSRT